MHLSPTSKLGYLSFNPDLPNTKRLHVSHLPFMFLFAHFHGNLSILCNLHELRKLNDD